MPSERAGDKPLPLEKTTLDRQCCRCGHFQSSHFGPDSSCTAVSCGCVLWRLYEPPAEPKPARMDTCGGVADTCEGCPDCQPAQPNAPAPEPQDRLREIAMDTAKHIFGDVEEQDWMAATADAIHAALARVVRADADECWHTEHHKDGDVTVRCRESQRAILRARGLKE